MNAGTKSKSGEFCLPNRSSMVIKSFVGTDLRFLRPCVAYCVVLVRATVACLSPCCLDIPLFLIIGIINPITSPAERHPLFWSKVGKTVQSYAIGIDRVLSTFTRSWRDVLGGLLKLRLLVLGR